MSRKTKDQQRMIRAVESLQKYMNTYSQQSEYANYRPETFIDDVLYGLGIALEPQQHYGASGYDRFKEVLREHLAKNQHSAAKASV